MLKKFFIQSSFLLVSCLIICACSSSKKPFFSTNSLQIEKLSSNVFVHIAYLDIPNYGKFACNGLVFKSQNQAIIFDTPPNPEATEDLISWIQDDLKCKIVGVVVNHFHDDCLGTLPIFHAQNIPSYAHQLTLELAEQSGETIPLYGFDNDTTLQIGNEYVENAFWGTAHTQDNIISYIPSEKVLFGGCMIKSINARKGNLADADTLLWSKTIEKIKNSYSEINYVVPGHGKTGGTELLDYTMKLFEVK